MTDQTQPQQQAIEIDAPTVLKMLQQTHPDVYLLGIWRFRAEKAEAEAAALKGAAGQSA